MKIYKIYIGYKLIYYSIYYNETKCVFYLIIILVCGSSIPVVLNFGIIR